MINSRKRRRTEVQNCKKRYSTHERYIVEQKTDWKETLTCGLWSDENQCMNIRSCLNKKLTFELIAIFKITEHSDKICRNFWWIPRCRGYKAAITTAESGDLAFVYEKLCGWPLACCCRPKITVFDTDEAVVGQVVNKWGICKIKMLILDKDEEPIYSIVGSMSSIAYCWESICTSWSPMVFEIQDIRKENQVLSKIVKHTMGCCKDFMTNADKYYLDFSSVMSYEERILLTIALHELDMLYFERKSPLIWC